MIFMSSFPFLLPLRFERTRAHTRVVGAVSSVEASRGGKLLHSDVTVSVGEVSVVNTES